VRWPAPSRMTFSKKKSEGSDGERCQIMGTGTLDVGVGMAMEIEKEKTLGINARMIINK
jgi:hypothetical protein